MGRDAGCGCYDAAILSECGNVPLRETRTAFFGGRGAKAQMVRGKSVKDDRRGGAPGLHKRGTGSAEDRGGGRKGRVAPILDGLGIHPRISHERERGGLSRPEGPQRSVARKHSVARMATCPKHQRAGLIRSFHRIQLFI